MLLVIWYSSFVGMILLIYGAGRMLVCAAGISGLVGLVCSALKYGGVLATVGFAYSFFV